MDWITKMRIMLLLHAFMFRNIACVCVLYLDYQSRYGQRASKQHSSPMRQSPTTSTRRASSRRWSLITKMPDQMKHLREIVNLNDTDCINNLRMDRNAFGRLCYLLEHNGGLQNEKFVSIPEKVAIFLSILAHHKKNTAVKHDFKRSGHTISKYFKQVLKATLKISPLLLVEPQPVPEDCTNETWKSFQGCLGALDGTYIEVRVATTDRTRYRSPKGDICVNVLGVCNTDMNFVYLLAGWEGSATNNEVLQDALNRRHGLKMPTGNYYLCDYGYANTEGFLTPYSGTRYHLKEWQEGGSAPQNAREYFNMKHCKARNVIDRAFILLKGRWAVLRSTTFYPIQTQNWIILACALLHNFIRTHMDVDPFEDELLDGEEISDQQGADSIDVMDSSPTWNNFRDTMATSMYTSWRGNPNL